MKIAIVSDLHLGVATETIWHNRQMHAHGAEIARAAVALLNRQPLDRVIVLGDVTQSGLATELVAGQAILSELAAPWWVIPGNHDRAAVATGDFDRVFAGHIPASYEPMGPIGLLFARELWPHNGDKGQKPLDWRGPEAAIAAAADHAPALLLVCTHYPLLPTGHHAQQHNGKYAGHFDDGETLVNRLHEVVPGRIVLLSGHQHWHHVIATPAALQCATGSLVEYPMECRVLTIDDGALHASMLPTASPEEARASLLDGMDWVRGDAADRAFALSLR